MSKPEWMKVENNTQRISRTNYFQLFMMQNPGAPGEVESEILNNFAEDTNSYLRETEEKGEAMRVNMAAPWFQVYEKGDFHGYHRHPGSNYSCVMYVSLPGSSGGTQFKISDKVYNPAVKEGQILMFPSSVRHRSPPWELDENKVIISWNINL
jgi:hypothetical protein